MDNLEIIELKELKEDNTALIVVDMVKGFVKEGALSSERVMAMSKSLIALNKKMNNYQKVFFVDSHTEDSVEFISYPKHCVAGTSEEELIDELREAVNSEENITVAKKNSTNGFHSKEFKVWIRKKENLIENFIIVGCVTDICVMQFALTLKTYFNELNLNKRVIIPKNCVETFDLPGHNGDEMNDIALTIMRASGIEIVSEIIYDKEI